MQNTPGQAIPMSTRLKLGTVALSVLGVFAVACAYAASPRIDLVRDAVDRSSAYLVQHTRADGMFDYRINMDPRIEVTQRYNILRHAGTIYAMFMSYRLSPDPDLRAAMARAGQFLRDKAIHPVAGSDEMLAVWSEPEVNKTGKPRQAKLGGTGLGLVALMSLERIQPGFTPLSDLQALGRFIVYMQKEDGAFYSKYIPSTGGRSDKWQSLYYPGEAVLGLLMLYDKDPADAWLQAAGRTLEYLARSRRHVTHVPADHWALLATEKILSLDHDAALPVARGLLINHAVQICEAILRDQIQDPERPDYDGGFTRDGRTTPTATRLEGLQAALSFLPHNHGLREPIEAAVSRGMSFLLRAQISEGEFLGAFPRAVGKIDRATREADAFNRRATEVRIDYVQHALSAMIQYLHLRSGPR